MTILSLAARRLSFAHLAGFATRGARAEDDKPEDEDTKQGRRADDDSPEEQDRDDGNGSKGKKGKRAEDRNDDPDAEDDEMDDSSKGKKGKRADDDADPEAEDDDDTDPDAEDDDGEMRGKSAVARARLREQARCAAIMGSKAAGRNVELAANLAFKTRMTRQEALAVLRSSPAASTANHSRAARNPNLGAGGEMQRSSAHATSSGWERAFSKVTGKRA
ncbi:hypothetical protein [Pandoraea apista]|uniref:hypothetical protein n=1 Tax=Pandoraea apista TaxID=93218 RepID=UPI000659D768|nr:hypothetical protein [Pandoraea apista]ALS63651.1 hypothetical protein AT395_00335 [Pandoraea apista]OXS92635.1 hypothetical protein B7H01_16995 [Pandoraea apista]CFB63183.1 hypothetical protein LMG16407_03258 [Pandoraea apista]